MSEVKGEYDTGQKAAPGLPELTTEEQQVQLAAALAKVMSADCGAGFGSVKLIIEGGKIKFISYEIVHLIRSKRTC